MKQLSASSKATRVLHALPILALACAGACNTGQSSAPATTGGQLGAVVSKPGGGRFVVTSNQAGQAQSMRITGMFWGRLVDVYETVQATGQRQLVFPEFVIGDNIATDGFNYVLERNPITEIEELVILHEFGTPGWEAAFSGLETQLKPFLVKGLSINEAPPFTAMPRNAVLVAAFDDLLVPSSIDATTVQLRVGSPPTQFIEARVFADPNHGDIADYDALPGAEYYPTRVIIDPQISEFEATKAALQVNGVGLPEAPLTTQANVVVKFPTLVNPIFGQTTILQNPTAHGVGFSGNGPVDATSQTGDVVRVFRSGNAADPFNGFLRDQNAPELIGRQSAFIQNIQPVGGTADEFTLDLDFTGSACAVSARAGDVLQASGVFAEVLAPVQLAVPTSLFGLRVRLLTGVLSIGSVTYLSPYDAGSSVPACFVQFKPGAASLPAGDVPVDAAVGLRFSEPMDPSSVGAFDSFRVERVVQPANPMESLIVGEIIPSSDARDFQFRPCTDLAHVQGQSESYRITLSNALTDLAGNSPVVMPPPILFQIDSTEPTRDTGGLVMRFDSTDEDDVAGPEWRGNVLFDASQGIVRPRPVSRFSAAVDTNVPQISLMGPGVVSVPQPLSKEGSRLMALWRHIDMSLGLLDEATFDIDVEGLNWAPFGGALSFDSFGSFRIALAHSNFLPDEVLTAMGTAQYPASGLITNFDSNLLDPVNDPLKVVHSDTRTYTIQALDTFPTATGLTVTPYPMNQGIPLDQYSYYTYRDTSIAAMGAPSGNGADPDAFFAAQGLMIPNTKTFGANAVPTIGLPLLMEFRCRPDTTAFGLNGFNTVLPTPIPTAIGPGFRVHASGGVDGQGVTQTVDPYTTSTAQFANKTFYLGQADFVVRVSRAHSRWFDTRSLSGATYEEPVVELLEAPEGTQVVLAYRGATNVMPADGTGGGSAANIGAYGNPGPTAQNPGVGFAPTFLEPSGAFQDSVAALDGSRFFQVRVTFVSNAATGLSPKLSALGFAFDR